MKTIKGSIEFLEKIKSTSSQIDNSIDKLSKELLQVEASLNATEGTYTLDEIKKTQAIRKDIEILKDTILTLKNRKVELIHQSAQATLEEAERILDNNRKEKQAKHLKDRQRITILRQEADQINEELKETDYQYTIKEKEFVNEVNNYLTEEIDLREPYSKVSQKKRLSGKVTSFYGNNEPLVLNAKRAHFKAPLDYSLEVEQEKK